MIEALSPYEAMEKATRLGESRKVSYQTASGEKLVWEFFKVERVFEIDEGLLIDGAELFSRHLRNAEVESLLKPFDDDQER